jgi:hypothetical protein
MAYINAAIDNGNHHRLFRLFASQQLAVSTIRAGPADAVGGFVQQPPGSGGSGKCLVGLACGGRCSGCRCGRSGSGPGGLRWSTGAQDKRKETKKWKWLLHGNAQFGKSRFGMILPQPPVSCNAAFRSEGVAFPNLSRP